jgi:acyl dehydratase
MATTKTLDRAPGAGASYLKAFGSALPVIGRLPFLPGGGGSTIPDTVLEIPEFRTDPVHLAAYAKVCGFTLRDTLPLTYLNVSAANLHLALLTDGAMPFGPIGLVHLENTITQHRPIAVRETLAVKVWATGLDPHPKGRLITLHTEVRSGKELVWEARTVALTRGGGSPDASSPAPLGVPDDLPVSATWRLPGDLGRRYGAVSGDRNPIHMNDYAAKALGFPRAIAHGLWTKARAVAALEGRLPDACTVTVRFRKPVLLPATVTFGSAVDGDTTYFAVRDRKGKTHLEGTVTPLAPKKKPATRAKSTTKAKKATTTKTRRTTS